MSFTALLATADALTRDTLGESVTYTPSVGAPVTVTGIFDEQYQRVEVGTPGVSSSGPAVSLLLLDLPTDPTTDNATLTIRGTQYEIKEAQPDGQGWVVLLLQEV